MSMFGGARQRILAMQNNTRPVTADGLPKLGGSAGVLETVGGASPRFGGGATGNPPGVLSLSQWSVPADGAPMPVAGVRLADTMPKKGNGFFSKNGAWRDVVGSLGDALSGNPIYMNAKLRQQQAAQEEAKLQQQRDWDIQDRDWKASQPDYFMSGRDRVRYNPRTGAAEVVYDGTEDFEQYAQTMGIEPGTDKYFTAVQDYVLRGNGPTAYGFDKQLDDHRTANDKRLDDYRTGNRVKVRSQPTWRDRNPAAPRPRATVSKRPRATNAQGQAVEWNGKEWATSK